MTFSHDIIYVTCSAGLLIANYNGDCGFNAAEGKMAKLIVESSSPECTCETHRDCSACMEDMNCRWKNKRCKKAPSSYTSEKRKEEKLSMDQVSIKYNTFTKS